VGAGLGGGSSNAASVLKILAKHFNVRIHQGTSLQRLGLELGSDIPFFLTGKPAYAAGRGEKLSPLPNFKIKYKILIVNPGIHVSTLWAYNKLRIADFGLHIENKFKKITQFKISDKDRFVNDFEKVVFKRYPKIKKIKEMMYELDTVFSLMSGSGSTVYGFFLREKIKAAKNYFSNLGYKVFES
ncbi:MAG TPA: 4-(cytidine 5'-diphospho)-2-C-methyl-D-erythritol kinase, partial [Ignavibacteria bacterium]